MLLLNTGECSIEVTALIGVTNIKKNLNNIHSYDCLV